MPKLSNISLQCPAAASGGIEAFMIALDDDRGKPLVFDGGGSLFTVDSGSNPPTLTVAVPSANSFCPTWLPVGLDENNRLTCASNLTGHFSDCIVLGDQVRLLFRKNNILYGCYVGPYYTDSDGYQWKTIQCKDANSDDIWFTYQQF